MSKFGRDPETGEYVCPECERKYSQYNSLFKHYDIKHGDSVRANSDVGVNKAGGGLTKVVEEPLKTVAPKTLRRVRLQPVIPPVVKPVKKAEKKSEKKPKKNQDYQKEEETGPVVEDGGWLVPGLIRASPRKKQKAVREDVDKKWLLIKGII